MTVGEIIKELQKFDSELKVYVPDTTGFNDYNVALSVEPKHLVIEDDGQDEQLVIVIDEV